MSSPIWRPVNTATQSSTKIRRSSPCRSGCCVAIEKQVLLASQRKIRSVVIRPTLIYGRGHGLNPDSMQLPHLIELAQKFGVARHVGRGLNVWSHVHIDDVVDLYLLALESAGLLAVLCRKRRSVVEDNGVVDRQDPRLWSADERLAGR